MRSDAAPLGPPILFLLFALLSPARPAAGHGFDPVLLDLRERAAGVFDVRWVQPAAVSAAVEPAPILPAHCRQLSEPMPNGTAAERHSQWRIDCRPGGLHGATVRVENLSASRADALLRVLWLDGSLSTAVLHASADGVALPGSRAAALGLSPGEIFQRYLRLGLEHIAFGLDHLLFVMLLVLLVGNWRALVQTITAFTAAHTLSLALATVGFVRLPPPPVEAMIAFSVVLLAVELARAPGGAASRPRLWSWAFGFGLLHGLGFAGALADIGLPPDQIPLALLSFNAGVELGQLVFVAALLPVAELSGRLLRSGVFWVHRVPAYVAGTVAAFWMIERVAPMWAP